MPGPSSPSVAARERVQQARIARHLRPLGFEPLERRTLMDGTPLSPGQATALLQGIQAFVAAGYRVDSQAEVLTRPLPILARPASGPGQSTTPVSIAALESLGFVLGLAFGPAESYLSST